MDKSCPKAGNPGVSVCDGHDVKLNQTNIANNNNKFYILQVQYTAHRALVLYRHAQWQPVGPYKDDAPDRWRTAQGVYVVG